MPVTANMVPECVQSMPTVRILLGALSWDWLAIAMVV